MSFFCCNKIVISKLKNVQDVLAAISYNLKKLCYSPVDLGKIMIGGDYHKKYYKTILKHFCDENNIVFNAKNASLAEFLCNLKYNLCNYGLFFYREEENVVLKIYSGNCVVLSKMQQNFLEKTMPNNLIVKENENAVFTKYYDFYKIDFLNFQLVCKNKRLSKAIKKTNIKSDFKVVVLENYKYFVLYKNKRIKVKDFFSNFKRVNKVDDSLIENLIKNNNSRVANVNGIVYNKNIYNFDILKTLKLISEKTYDDNFRKLVFKT